MENLLPACSEERKLLLAQYKIFFVDLFEHFSHYLIQGIFKSFSTQFVFAFEFNFDDPDIY